MLLQLLMLSMGPAHIQITIPYRVAEAEAHVNRTQRVPDACDGTLPCCSSVLVPCGFVERTHMHTDITDTHRQCLVPPPPSPFPSSSAVVTTYHYDITPVLRGEAVKGLRGLTVDEGGRGATDYKMYLVGGIHQNRVFNVHLSLLQRAPCLPVHPHSACP